MTERNKRFLIVQERLECHQSIFDEINETEHFDIRILKEPNTNKLRPASKVIVVVGTEEQAEHIRQHCLDTVQQTNDYVDDLLAKSSPRYKINYKVNIVHAKGDVFLSVHAAQSRKTAEGKAVIGTLESYLKELDENKEQDKKLIDTIRRYIALVNPESQYTWAKSTGNNYRLTYFDPNKSQRMQISVDHITVIVGDQQTRIQDAPERKERTDRKQPLFVLAVPLHGVISVYPS